jgi:hypothetical protein
MKHSTKKDKELYKAEIVSRLAQVEHFFDGHVSASMEILQMNADVRRKLDHITRLVKELPLDMLAITCADSNHSTIWNLKENPFYKKPKKPIRLLSRKSERISTRLKQ